MNRREKLLACVEAQHQGQLIRRTQTPYMHHLTTVAETVDHIPLGYETGLCRDLLEKTEVSPAGLQTQLIQFGYSEKEAELITSSVVELTNVFTKTAFPHLKSWCFSIADTN